MAFKIVWSNQALEDLRSIVSFIASDNPTAAEHFGYLLMTRVDVLEEHPRFGRVVPEEGNEDIREIIVRPYRVIYLVIEPQKIIGIARLWHGARGEPQIPPVLDL